MLGIGMNENKEYIGEYWLPNYPEGRIKGVLKFTKDDGWILEIRDVLNNQLFDKDYFAPEIILGYANGKILLFSIALKKANHIVLQ